ncbi:MAG: RidA family protein [Pseudomonadales bacterium]|nr:RidA family protein [Pseudomonadales bacterium]
MAESLNAKGAPKPAGPYSNATWERPEGRLLFIAGQVGITTDYKPVGDGGIEEQTKQTFRNIRAIVEDAGGTMADIVSLVIYVTDIKDAVAVNKVRGETFDSTYPSSTLLQVSAFMHPSLLVEISAVASIRV